MDYTTLNIEASNLITRIRRYITNLMITDWEAYKANKDRLEDILAMAEDRFYRRVEKQQAWQRYEDAADWGIA